MTFTGESAGQMPAVQTPPDLPPQSTMSGRSTKNSRPRRYEPSPGVSLPNFWASSARGSIGSKSGGSTTGSTTPDKTRLSFPGGTVEVTVNGVTMEASAPALMFASPVWCLMLQGSNQSGPKHSGRTRLPLGGDDKAAAVLLSIIHYRFFEIPDCLSLCDLYNLTLMVAEYKCAHLLYPYASTWVNHLMNDREACGQSECHKALWIAYTLGNETWYKKTLETMILTAKLDANGELVSHDGLKLVDMILPAKLLDIIAETRAVLLETILASVASPMGGDQPTTQYCRVGKNEAECQAMMVGSVVPQLIREKLYPTPKAGEYRESVESLAHTAKNFKLLTFSGQGSAPHESHIGCNLGLSDAIDSILADMPLVLTEEHQKHLSTQGKLTGLIRKSEAQEVKTATQDSKGENRTIRETWVERALSAPSTPKETDGDLRVLSPDSIKVENCTTPEIAW